MAEVLTKRTNDTFLHQMFPLRDNGGVTLRWSRVKMSEGEREEKGGVDDDVDLKIQQFLMVPTSKSRLTLTGLDMLRRLSDGEWRRRG